MAKVDIFSGFLGAGKTTLIKKLIAEAYEGEKLVLIENEFGEIAVDGGFLKDAGIEITEMSSGCICCSLVGDFAAALERVKAELSPDRILIEPSGVGKLSDVIRAVRELNDPELEPGAFVTVVDAARARMYMRNFGEFWCDQVESAGAIALSRTSGMSEEKLAACTAMLREHNPEAVIVTTPWDELDGKQLRAALENEDSLKVLLDRLSHEHEHEHEHEHHHDHDHDHDHDHEHDHEHEHEHEHDHEHHHDHDHEHHHHEHGETCSCGCGHEHHHHDADEVFTSWGGESARKYTEDELSEALDALDSGWYGTVVRAKGYVDAEGEGFIYFDYVPGECDIRRGPAAVTGRFCVIGSDLKETRLKELFRIG